MNGARYGASPGAMSHSGFRERAGATPWRAAPGESVGRVYVSSYGIAV